MVVVRENYYSMAPIATDKVAERAPRVAQPVVGEVVKAGPAPVRLAVPGEVAVRPTTQVAVPGTARVASVEPVRRTKGTPMRYQGPMVMHYKRAGREIFGSRMTWVDESFMVQL